MLRTINIKTRMIGGFGLIFLTFLVINVVVISRMDSLSNLINLMYMHPLTVSNAVLRVDGNIVRMHRSMKDVALAQSDAEIDAASKQVDEYEQAIYRDFTIIEERFLGDKTMYEEAIAAFSDWKQIRDQVISLMYQGKSDEAAAITKGVGAQHVDRINAAMLNLDEFAQNKAVSFLSDALNTKNELLLQISIMFAILIISGLFLAILVTRSIVQPLSNLMTGVIEIKDGNLEKQISLESNDEIGQLGVAFNGMTRRLKKSNQGLEKEIIERKQAEAALAQSEARYRHIFETINVSIWEEDASELIATIDSMKAQGVTDFRSYLKENPDFIERAIKMVNILNVNQETLQLHGAQSKEDLLTSLDRTFVPESIPTFCDELVAIANGELYFESESVIQTLQGKRIDILLKLALPAKGDDFNNVLVSMMDITKIKQAEKLLKESEAFLTETGRMAKVGGWEVDAKTFEVTWTEETYRIYEISSNHGIPLNDAINFYHPDDRPKLESAIQKAFEHGQPYDIESRFITAKGNHLWVHTTCKPIVVDGQTVKLTGAFQDITERKQAENALQQRNWELDQLYHASGVLFSSTISGMESLAQSIVSTIQQRFEYSNCSLFLVKQDSLELHRIVAIGPYVPQLESSIFPINGSALVASVARSGQILNIPDVAVHPDYLRGWQSARSELVVPLIIGDWVIGVISLQSSELAAFGKNDERLLTAFASRAALALHNARLFEQSERRTQELEVMTTVSSALRTAETQNEMLMLVLNEAVTLMNADGAVLAINDPDTDEIHFDLAQGIWSHMTGLRFPSGEGATGQVIRTGLPHVSQYSDDDLHFLSLDVTGDSGMADNCAAACVPLMISEEVTGALWVGREKDISQAEVVLLTAIADIAANAIQRMTLYEKTLSHTTELEKRVNSRTAELSKSNAELARATRLKDEFLANMSHELRTPLTAVLGRSDLLQEEIYGPLNQRQRHALKDITESGRHLLELINDILDLSKIGVGKLDLEISTVAVESISQASLRMIKEMALKKQLRVTSSFDNKITTMQADQRRLKQILVNLLSNAVKFTPERGELGLEVTVNTAEDLIQFTVWDTGIGIAPEQIPLLFQPFVQLDSKLGRQHEGAGLGLSLVARLTEMHGGNVSVESKVGLGSRFTITLPWKEPIHIGTKPLTSIKYDSVIFAQLPSIGRTLIIEDSLSAANQIALYLAEFETETIIYPQGLGALDKAIEVQPQLIILDIQLPDAVGWDILQQLKQETRTQNIPVLIISVVDERQHGLRLGAAGYLVKPVSKENVQRTIRNIFKPSTKRYPALVTAPMERLVLLAEDNEANIETISDFIQAVGYRIVVARNGAEAIERANELSPDIILMDIQMPGMDGLEATRQLRANADFDKTPIIALTGLAMPGDREYCLAAGANEYMTKPINFPRLYTVINSLLHT